MSITMKSRRVCACVIVSLALAATNLNGCAYTAAMAKAEADRSRINTEQQKQDAAQQRGRDRTVALEDEHARLRTELGALHHTLASQQRRLAALSVVPARRRGSGQQAQIAQVQSEIAVTKRRLAEKEERMRYINQTM
jgi:chromosome segregation ATPase